VADESGAVGVGSRESGVGIGNFRELLVWRRSQDLALEVYRSTTSFPKEERYGLTAQMRRAAISVSSNIAEGCGRQGDRELARFLQIARGSVRELECQLDLSSKLGYIESAVYTKLDSETQEISRMLNRLIHSFRSPPTRAPTPDS
jgi:four helix bundle protein